MDSVLNFLYLTGAIAVGVVIGTMVSQFLATVILVWNDGRIRKQQMARLNEIAAAYEQKIASSVKDEKTENLKEKKVKQALDALGVDFADK